jgi:hypothetical protein
MNAMRTENRPKRRRLLASASCLGFALILSALPTDGAAQPPPYDHLECFKLQAHGTTWAANAHADDALDVTLPASLTPPFVAFGSGVELLPGSRPQPKELCVPVNKDPSRAPAGSELRNGFACYDVKYKRSSGAGDVSLTDQFASGSVLTREGRRKLCVPITIP